MRQRLKSVAKWLGAGAGLTAGAYGAYVISTWYRYGREIVMGAVTKPWEANVVFRSIAPGAFSAFSEPGYVKIAWTLRADPVGETFSTFRTETRAVATDVEARRRFRRYWAFLSPGISLVRWLSLSPLKREAESRAQLSSTNEAVRQS